MTPYWSALHGLDQPDRPTADDAIRLLRAVGLDVHSTRWTRTVQMIGEIGDDRVDHIARRLCLPPARVHELEQVVTNTPPPVERQVLTVWW